MKRIYISYKGVSEYVALKRAHIALKEVPKDERTGVVVFCDDVKVAFNEKAKNLTMTVFK